MGQNVFHSAFCQLSRSLVFLYHDEDPQARFYIAPICSDQGSNSSFLSVQMPTSRISVCVQVVVPIPLISANQSGGSGPDTPVESGPCSDPWPRAPPGLSGSVFTLFY